MKREELHELNLEILPVTEPRGLVRGEATEKKNIQSERKKRSNPIRDLLVSNLFELSFVLHVFFVAPRRGGKNGGEEAEEEEEKKLGQFRENVRHSECTTTEHIVNGVTNSITRDITSKIPARARHAFEGDGNPRRIHGAGSLAPEPRILAS